MEEDDSKTLDVAQVPATFDNSITILPETDAHVSSVAEDLVHANDVLASEANVMSAASDGEDVRMTGVEDYAVEPRTSVAPSPGGTRSPISTSISGSDPSFSTTLEDSMTDDDEMEEAELGSDDSHSDFGETEDQVNVHDVQVIIPMDHTPGGEASSTKSFRLDPSKTCFLDLPAEIRNEVYNYLFSTRTGQIVIHSPHTKLNRITGSWSRRGTRIRTNAIEGTPLFGTCKTIHHETIGYVYGSNRISFEDTTDAKTFLSGLRSTTLASLKNIDIGWITPLGLSLIHI